MWHELEALLSPASKLLLHAPLATRTTLRVGGPADCLVEPASEADLALVMGFCHDHSIPVTLLGRGSNLLIQDGGVRGVVVHLGAEAFTTIQVQEAEITARAGVRLKQLAAEARRHGLSGFEFMEGIPGCLGGSLRMNAGAMGSWMFDRVKQVRLMTWQGTIEVKQAADIPVVYRSCPLLKTHIALEAVLKGEPDSPEAIAATMESFSTQRRQSQPSAKSAGCMFKNPEAIPAGKLIQELGLKGTRVGQAVVSEVHGNFIINEGQATARDVLGLIRLIQDKAQQERGITLEQEVQVIGDQAEPS